MFRYDDGDFDLVMNFENENVYVGAILFDGSRVQASTTEDVTIDWPEGNEITLDLTESGRNCTAAFQEITASGEAYRLYRFTKTCLNPSATGSAEITVTKISTGETKVLGGSASGSGGGGGGGGGGGENFPYHSVFVSSTTHNGNFGGLNLADSYCNTLGRSGDATNPLPGIWKAILSSQVLSAASRLDFEELPIMNTKYVAGAPSFEVVEDLATDLWDSPYELVRSIEYDEDGNLVSSGTAWTGTSTSGGIVSGQTCASWTATASAFGALGNLENTDSSWVKTTVPASCDQSKRVYCINIKP